MQTEETESHGRVVDVLDRTEPAVAHAIWTQVPFSFKCARVYVVSHTRSGLVREKIICRCHIGGLIGYWKEFSDTNEKTNFITHLKTPRDEFIKPN
jgi:hypothetical protein